LDVLYTNFDASCVNGVNPIAEILRTARTASVFSSAMISQSKFVKYRSRLLY